MEKQTPFKDGNATAKNLLTQGEAAERCKLVSNVKVDLQLHLTKGSPTYSCECKIHFDVPDQKAVLQHHEAMFLEFSGTEIHLLKLNQHVLGPEAWRAHRLLLPAEKLQAHNELQVSYVNEFNHNGNGFHYFKDPEDGEEYTYT